MSGQLFTGERPVHSVFALSKRNEDALSYALGYLLAIDPPLFAEFLKTSGVTRRRPVRQLSKEQYYVHLQDRDDLGRRDIIINLRGLSAVVEAKIASGQPRVEQLVKYRPQPGPAERAVIALTRGPLDHEVRRTSASRLEKDGISLHELQWHHVLAMVEERLNDLPHPSREHLLFRDFVRFFTEDYEMRYYDVEVFIQDVNKENRRIFEEGWLYVSSADAHAAPLYFAPYFTNECAVPGVYRAARVLHVEHVDNIFDRELTGRLEKYFLELARASVESSKEVDLARNWKDHWIKGVKWIVKRAKREQKAGKGWGAENLYFLGQPFDLLHDPIKKPGNFRQLPRNFSRTIEELKRGIFI